MWDKHDYFSRPHQTGLGNAAGPEGRLVQITILIGERLTALKHLEQMNMRRHIVRAQPR
jgi:hypothetical protein